MPSTFQELLRSKLLKTNFPFNWGGIVGDPGKGFDYSRELHFVNLQLLYDSLEDADFLDVELHFWVHSTHAKGHHSFVFTLWHKHDGLILQKCTQLLHKESLTSNKLHPHSSTVVVTQLEAFAFPELVKEVSLPHFGFEEELGILDRGGV